ncbi:ankyrin repeat domain-containing protein [Dysgonomonas reticulitermitis]
MDNFEDNLKNAIACNDVHFLEKHINQHNIDYRFLDEDNDTLLLYAISDKGSEAYIFFLNNGANLNLVNDEGEGIFHSIVYSGLSERLIDILNREPDILKFINSQTKDGVSPLLLSVLLGKDDIFNLLLDLNADLNLADNENYAPIHSACFLGYKEMVLKLVAKGVNLHVKTKRGNYPLALAINEDNEEISKYLFEKFYIH